LPLISVEFPYLCSSLFVAGLASEGRGRVGATGEIVPSMGKNVVLQGSVRGDARDLIRKTALLDGKLAEARWAREVDKE
jgi:hypothetical protein